MDWAPLASRLVFVCVMSLRFVCGPLMGWTLFDIMLAHV